MPSLLVVMSEVEVLDSSLPIIATATSSGRGPERQIPVQV
jgi:hypothetical protein